MRKIKTSRGFKKIGVIIFLAAILTTGCSIQLGTAKKVSTAGIFKSFDKGNTWTQKNLFLFSGGVGNIAGLNVVNLTFDPQDNRAIYLASDAQGLFYTYDAGDSWMKAVPVGSARIESVAVDPKDKCTIYATYGSTILKSNDCSRSWLEVYIDTRAAKAAVTALAIDNYNNLSIYAGNSAGDILKSQDGGANWQVINRLNDKVAKILVNPKDTRIVYVATKSKGIFKTTDSGGSWSDINEGLKPYSSSMEYKNLVFDLSQPNALLLVSKYGLIKTNDGGTSWEAIKLITPPASTDIYSAAINSQNNLEIYYSTATTFYKTVDGGKNWITKRLPSGAVSTFLAVDLQNPNIIYMGMTNFTKK
ncbi:MAG: YCF48-related protein [Candidatus Buchananbacteria bacterium]